MRILPLSILLSSLLGLVSPALAAQCPQAEEPSINITLDTGPVQFDRTQNINQLTVLERGAPSPVAVNGRGNVPLGLTSAKFETRYQIEARVATLSDGTNCASLSHITIQLLQPKTVVYIAQELPAGSCISREVEAHENKHVAVNNAILRDYQNRIGSELRQTLRSIGSVRVNTPQGGITSISAKVQPLLDTAINGMNNERLRRQAMIDTPQEYERVSRSCNGEAQRFLRNR